MRTSIWTSIVACAMASCAEKPHDITAVDMLPDIYPDYAGVTVPVGIAPLNFDMREARQLSVSVRGRDAEILAEGKTAQFGIEEWHELLRKSKGDSLVVGVTAKVGDRWVRYRDFAIYVSADTLAEWGLTYRRIAPGYETYSHMGIYQRNLSNYDEETIFDNDEVPGSCVNCHTGNRTSHSQYVYHIRGANGGTMFVVGNDLNLFDTKTDKTVGSLVYPSWHPGGRYVAFSSNKTLQIYHVVKDERIEVFDKASDILVYDTQEKSILVSPLINQTKEYLETYPVFSAKGDKIYFAQADMEGEGEDVNVNVRRYDLYSIDFDAESRSYGTKKDTVVIASRDSMSISHPRVSYDGKYLMYTTCNYGTFPIWHKEADMWLLDLETGERRRMDEVNSDDSDSYHNWSTDSHWFVFTSRRDDGLYTRLYMANIDQEGKISKPFMLPQKRPLEYYDNMLYSYNTPDFVDARIDFDAKKAARMLTKDERETLSVEEK